MASTGFYKRSIYHDISSSDYRALRIDQGFNIRETANKLDISVGMAYQMDKNYLTVEERKICANNAHTRTLKKVRDSRNKNFTIVKEAEPAPEVIQSEIESEPETTNELRMTARVNYADYEGVYGKYRVDFGEKTVSFSSGLLEGYIGLDDISKLITDLENVRNAVVNG